MREVNNKMYSVSAYFVARIIADIPNVLFFPTMTGTILYFVIGLNSTSFYKFPEFSKTFRFNFYSTNALVNLCFWGKLCPHNFINI